MKGVNASVNVYYVAGFPVTDELYHDDLEHMTFGRRDNNELWHYQIKGAKHGVRRFQNEDGSLTPAGRRRYDVGDPIMTSDTGTGSAGTKSKSNVVYTPSSNRSSGSNSVSPVSKAVKSATSAVSNAGKAALGAPKVSKEYLRELNYNSKTNSFGQNGSQSNAARTQTVKNTTNAGKAAADRLFGSASSALSTKSNQNGSASNQPYVSPEYQRELAYNSQQNVYPEAMTDASNKPDNVSESPTSQSTNEKKPGLFDRIGNAASGALDSAKNWAGDRVQDVGNAASGALDSAKNWTSGAVEDVKGLANTPFARDTANAVNGAIDKVQNAANNVADFVTGNKSREVLDKAYSDNINNGGNGSSPELDRARDAYNKTLPGMAEKAVDVARENVIPGIQEKVGNAANNVADFAKEAWKSPWVNPAEAVKVAGNWAGNAAKDVGNAASGALDSVKNWYTGEPHAKEAERLDNIAQNYQKIGDININSGTNKISDSISQRRAANDALAEAQAYKDQADRLRVSGNNSGADMANWQATAKNNEYNEHLNNSDELLRSGNDQQNRGWDQHDKSREYGSMADAEQAKYDSAPRQKVNGAIDSAKNLAGDVGNWLGDRARDIDYGIYSVGQNVGSFADNKAYQKYLNNIADDKKSFDEAWASGDYSKALYYSNKIDNAFSNYQREAKKIRRNPIGSSAGALASSVGEWGSTAVDSGKAAIQKLFGKKK